MSTLTKSIVMSLLGLCLAACSSPTQPDTSPVPSSDSTTVAPTETSDDIALDKLDEQIHKYPSEGGVKSYLLETDALNFGSGDGEWKSFLTVEGEIPVEWAAVTKAVIIPVCDADGGTFTLYKNGKNIADAPCGPGQVNSVSPPKPHSSEKEIFTYQITGATKAEVALYTEKISQ